MRITHVGALLISLALISGCSGPQPETVQTEDGNIETRIVSYLRDSVATGRPIVVSDLVNDVFTSPEEQVVLDRLFNAFFKIPLFLVQFQSSTGRLATLVEIEEQFNFEVPEQASVMLSVMESDSRIPVFFERDPGTGELTRLYVEPILEHPQFGEGIERRLAGWEGQALPEFEMTTFDGGSISSADLAGRPYMIYIWFSNCPPCLETSPLLVRLYEEFADRNFEIVAANADRVLELPYDDEVRTDYVEEVGIRFVTAHLTEEIQASLGGVLVFPTMFFVDRNGIVVRQLISFQDETILAEAIRATL